MARSKRASMREGPLADLFRSTEESVEPDEIRVTAASGAGVDVALGETEVAEPEAEVAEPPAPPEVPSPPEPEPTPQPQPSTEPEPEPEQPAQDEKPARAEESEEVRAYRAKPVEHEGLERLMGVAEAPEERPAFGRKEPDFTHAPAVVPAATRRCCAWWGSAAPGSTRSTGWSRRSSPESSSRPSTPISSRSRPRTPTSPCTSAPSSPAASDRDPTRESAIARPSTSRTRSRRLLKGSDMVFIAAGAGGGTGTGAAPVVAKLARDIDALTVGIVTKPFEFEGARRMAQAEEGVAALGAEVDTLIVVPNQRLITVLERHTSITDAFRVADDVLRQAVQGISDLITLPGLINLDFADVRTTMINAGDAILGIGMGVGDHRALLAAEKAVSSPLLNTSVEGAHSLLLSITGGPDLSLIEASEAAEVVRNAAHPDANIIFGANVDDDLHEEVWVTVIAARFDSSFAHRHRRTRHDEDMPFDIDRDSDGDRRRRRLAPPGRPRLRPRRRAGDRSARVHPRSLASAAARLRHQSRPQAATHRQARRCAPLRGRVAWWALRLAA